MAYAVTAKPSADDFQRQLVAALEKYNREMELGFNMQVEVLKTSTMFDGWTVGFKVDSVVDEFAQDMPFRIRIKVIYKLLADGLPQVMPGTWGVLRADGANTLTAEQSALTVANLEAQTTNKSFITKSGATYVAEARFRVRLVHPLF
jgi:hypothetical protein